MGLIEVRQLGSLARHKMENSRAQLGHSRGIKLLGAQLEHSWSTVEAKTVGAQWGHNIRTDERKVSSGTAVTQLSQIWDTHFSWGYLGQV